jgi:hypothetical protein
MTERAAAAERVLDVLQCRGQLSIGTLEELTGLTCPDLDEALAFLVSSDELNKRGTGPATFYSLPSVQMHNEGDGLGMHDGEDEPESLMRTVVTLTVETPVFPGCTRADGKAIAKKLRNAARTAIAEQLTDDATVDAEVSRVDGFDGDLALL